MPHTTLLHIPNKDCRNSRTIQCCAADRWAPQHWLFLCTSTAHENMNIITWTVVLSHAQRFEVFNICTDNLSTVHTYIHTYIYKYRCRIQNKHYVCHTSHTAHALLRACEGSSHGWPRAWSQPCKPQMTWTSPPPDNTKNHTTINTQSNWSAAPATGIQTYNDVCM